MKAILVIDMPKECFECPFKYNDGYSSEDKSTWFTKRCHLSHDQVYENEILENCPLKPMPQKENTFEKGLDEYGTGWRIGFNACIDEIIGAKNETE